MMSGRKSEISKIRPSEGAFRHPTIYLTAEIALVGVLALLIYGLARLL
jgi:hypothetical protein